MFMVIPAPQLVSLSLALILAVSPALAGDSKVSYKPDFPIGSKFSRALQKYTGLNLLTQTVASSVAGHALKRKTGGKATVKVKTFSLTDLIAGKVKSVEVKLQDASLKAGETLPGKLELVSSAPFWYRYKGARAQRGLAKPCLFNMQAKLEEGDLEKALASSSISNRLRGLKLDLPGLGEQKLSVMAPTVDIEGQALCLKATLVTADGKLENGLPIAIKATPRLQDESKIFLDNMEIEGEGIVEPEKFSRFTSSLLSPLIDFSSLDRKDHAFRLTSLRLIDGEAQASGKLLLAPKNTGEFDLAAKKEARLP
jgi:hypothetical protein